MTETAAEKLKELLAGRSDVALRVAIRTDGCSGLRYAMYLDDAVTDEDLTEEQFGVRVVIDRTSQPHLSEAEIDFVDTREVTGFTIDNPAAAGVCACSRPSC